MHISNQLLVFCDDLLAAWDGISCHENALLLPRRRPSSTHACQMSQMPSVTVSTANILDAELLNFCTRGQEMGCNCFSACRVRCAVVVRQLPRFVLELTCPTGSPRKRRADCCHLWIMFFVNLNIPGFLREFSRLTPPLPRYHLKTANKKSGKSETLENLCLLFLHWHVKGFLSKRIALNVNRYRTGKYTVCRRVRAFFSPDILQAGAVKGLSLYEKQNRRRCSCGQETVAKRKTEGGRNVSIRHHTVPSRYIGWVSGKGRIACNELE